MIDAANQLNLSPPSLTALVDASAAINSTLDLDTVLDQIARSAAEVSRAEAASVIRFDRRLNKLHFAAAVGDQGANLIGREFDAGLGIAGRIVRDGDAAIVRDVADHPDFFPGFDRQGRFQTRELMAAAMVYKKEVIGAVEVINRLGGGHFDDSDLALLRVFANLAAHAARNAQAHEDLKRQNLGLRESLMAGVEIIGRSEPLRRTMDLADRVARTNATVLLLGETGTGKELLAKYVHNASARRDKAFIGVNCAALTDTLLESELFGHEKGAFTGAVSQRVGRFELADLGTLFLDEIGDISASTQVRLLRVLQEREFTRVGGTRTIACDVRVLAATNRDLKRAIAEGRFRDDLYYRLNVFPITVPPLRQRREDIAPLAEHFALRASRDLGVPPRRISVEAAALLAAHAWPGNIRELANVVERAVLLSDGPEITSAQLPTDIAGMAAGGGSAGGVAAGGGATGDVAAGGDAGLWGYERAMIVRALEQSEWNQSQAARALGISRDNLRYRVKKYKIKRSGA